MPNNVLLFSPEKFIKTVDKHYLESLELTKKSMRSYLINYEGVKREIVEKIKRTAGDVDQKLAIIKLL